MIDVLFTLSAVVPPPAGHREPRSDLERPDTSAVPRPRLEQPMESGFTGRLLSTLGLPAVLVAKLKHAGYETRSDLAGTSQEELVKGKKPDFVLRDQSITSSLGNRAWNGPRLTKGPYCLLLKPNSSRRLRCASRTCSQIYTSFSNPIPIFGLISASH